MFECHLPSKPGICYSWSARAPSVGAGRHLLRQKGSRNSMAKEETHSCPTCGEATCEAGHLCTPVDHDDEECGWCGAMIVNQRHMCEGKLPEVAYICNSCGRTAVSPEHLCKPERIK